MENTTKMNSEHADNLRLAKTIFGESSAEYQDMLAHDAEQRPDAAQQGGPAGESMGTACVNRVKSMRDAWLARVPNSDDPTFKYHYRTRADAASEIITALESGVVLASSTSGETVNNRKRIEQDNIAPERVFLKACHPASPNHNCSWSVNKTQEDSVEYVRADLASRAHPFGSCGYKFCDWPDGELRCNEPRTVTSSTIAATRATEELLRENFLLSDVTAEEFNKIAAIISKHYDIEKGRY